MILIILAFTIVSAMFGRVKGASKTSDLNFVGFHDQSPMLYNASDMVAVTVPASIFNDGKGARIYITGGCALNQICDVTDPATQALFCYCPEVNQLLSYFQPQESVWHSSANLLRPRYRHMATRMGNYLYLLGGRDVDDNPITAIDRYNVLTNTWEFVIDWINATSDGVAWSIEKDQLIMIAGGYTAFYSTPGKLVSFNTNTQVFNENYPSMIIGRGDTQVANINDHEFYVIGGWTGDNFASPQNVVEKYNYLENTWTQVKSMTYGRGDLACGVMDGSIFAIGGETRPASDISNTHSIPVKVVERYLPWNNSWDFEESIPDNLFRFTGASWNSSSNVYYSAIYLFGGQGTFVNTTTAVDYFPVKKSTIQYIPQSTVRSSGSDELPPESIAGIVIGVVVAVGIVVTALIIYFTRRNFFYMTLKEEEPGLPSSANVSINGSQHDHEQAKMQYLEAEELREAFPAYAGTSTSAAAKQYDTAMVKYDEEAVL